MIKKTTGGCIEIKINMDIFKSIVIATGIGMSLAYFPQAYKIWKDKDARNISVFTFTLFALGTLIWTIYGFLIQDWILILSYIVGVTGSWTALILTLYYRKGPRNDTKI